MAPIFARERAQQRVEILADIRERFAQPVRLDRVLDVHRRGAEMDLAAADLRLRSEDADLGHQIVADLALDLERSLDVHRRSACARRSASSSAETRPLRICDSASATQTARHSRRRPRSENSSRNSARPYLHENGDAYDA